MNPTPVRPSRQLRRRSTESADVTAGRSMRALVPAVFVPASVFWTWVFADVTRFTVVVAVLVGLTASWLLGDVADDPYDTASRTSAFRCSCGQSHLLVRSASGRPVRR